MGSVNTRMGDCVLGQVSHECDLEFVFVTRLFKIPVHYSDETFQPFL